MSRILAVASPQSALTQPPFALLQPALQALAGPSRLPGSLPHLYTVDKCCLAWHGLGPANMAQRGHLRLIMDGVIYNNHELGTDDSVSDAVLLLTLIEHQGLDAVLPQLNGDFAFILHNECDNSFTLVRDRMGLRPLYYNTSDNLFAVASRPAALLALGISAEVNPVFTALFAASHYRVIDNDIHASPYAAIRQLPAGHLLRFIRGQAQVYPWWTPRDEDDWNIPEEELKERYRELFLDAVHIRLRHFRQPLFTLSGGMDSSAILATARHLTGRKQEAISTVYADSTYDESDAIRHMLDANVSHWHSVAVNEPNIFVLTQDMIAAHDEPVATATWLPHWLLSRQAAEQGADVVTSGLGGDELFGGEYEHFLFHFADLRAAGHTAELEHEIANWARLHNHPLYPKDASVAHASMDRLTAHGGQCVPDRARIDRYADALQQEYFDLRAYAPVMDHPFRSHLKNRCWQDILRETSPCCIRAQDRHGAAHGIGVIMPFFDPRLADFLFRVPGHYKIRHGGNKYLARQAMRGILPKATCSNIVKTGWNAPAHIWFSGEGHTQLMDMLHSQTFKERGIYIPQTVQRLAREHLEIISQGLQCENHMMFLWQVINVELWLQWVDRKGWLL